MSSYLCYDVYMCVIVCFLLEGFDMEKKCLLILLIGVCGAAYGMKGTSPKDSVKDSKGPTLKGLRIKCPKPSGKKASWPPSPLGKKKKFSFKIKPIKRHRENKKPMGHMNFE